MAVNSAWFRQFNCIRSTIFDFQRTSNLQSSSRSINYSSNSTPKIHLRKKGPNRNIIHQSVTFGRQKVVNESSFRFANTGPVTTSRYKQFRKLLNDFAVGGKSLFQDVKLTWRIRRKLRDNNWNYDMLERKDLWKMFKTQRNLKKALPIVLLSCLPVIGYLGPIIGFLRPRQFLSSHFWTEKQKEKFLLLDNKERAECRSFVFNIISEKTKKPGNEEQVQLQKITAMADLGNDVPWEKTFMSFSNGSFDLDNLERRHLQKLCSFWIMRSVWPSFMLRRNLRKEMVEIHMDDIALTREGIEILDEEQLKEACHVRGLDTSNISTENLQNWLQDWLTLTKDISENETSFLAHHPLFKAMNVVQETQNSTEKNNSSQIRSNQIEYVDRE